MIEQKQLYLHKPEEGSIGDCWRTCIACLLDVPVDYIPHYYLEYWKHGENIAQLVQGLTNKFLVPFGVQYIECPLECTYEQLRAHLAYYYKDMYVMVGCNSKNGGHSVIMKNTDYIWDPAIDNSGCVGPMDDGYYWVGLLVSTRHLGTEK